MLSVFASDALLPARNQMALSLGWHIILACFGMAFPAMIFVLHRRGLKGDDVALELAKRWSKVAAVLFAIGAVSGTILSFELGLLWPGLMEQYGDVVGLYLGPSRTVVINWRKDAMLGAGDRPPNNGFRWA